MQHSNTKEDLIKLLQHIDEKLTHSVSLVLIGGTALTLLDKKAFSYDIDIIIASKVKEEEFEEAYFEAVKKFKLDMGIHPPYYDFDMGLLNIKDYLEESQPINEISLENITLRAMNINDIILSKNFRNLKKDNDDIVGILSQMNISKATLQARYLQLFRQQTREIRPKFDESYKRFLTNYGSLLKP